MKYLKRFFHSIFSLNTEESAAFWNGPFMDLVKRDYYDPFNRKGNSDTPTSNFIEFIKTLDGKSFKDILSRVCILGGLQLDERLWNLSEKLPQTSPFLPTTLQNLRNQTQGKNFVEFVPRIRSYGKEIGYVVSLKK